MRVVYSSIRDTCKATREIEAPPTLLSDYRHGADAHCGPRKAGLAERQKSSPALFAQEQVSVTHLPRKSCPRYGKEKVNAARPTVHLACEGRIVFLRETAVVAGCIIVVEGDPARCAMRAGTTR